MRRQHPVFGTGSMEVVSTDNPSVLAYVRASGRLRLWRRSEHRTGTLHRRARD